MTTARTILSDTERRGPRPAYPSSPRVASSAE